MHIVFPYGEAIKTYSTKQRLSNNNSTVMERHDVEAPLLEALFAVRREEHPRCELRSLRG
jgi:hypothetical protein